MKYRLGLDMGATSIGWAVINIDNGNIEDFGVRIFPDGREDKSKASLCVKRRDARGARRLQKRHIIRKNQIIKTLVDIDLFPRNINERKNLEFKNPYELRSKAVTQQIELYELGRALFHLSQRRGFMSSRKDDKEEGGKLKKGFADLKEAMKAENCITYGQYLYEQQLKNPKDNIRLKDSFDENGKFKGNKFPFRETYKQEFDIIWNKQAMFYPQILTSKNKEALFDIIFFQRPLKEQEEGFCMLEDGEKRIAKASPLFQEFRLLQVINNLKFSEETSVEYKIINENKRGELIEALMNPEEIKTTKDGRASYSEIKKYLKLPSKGVFNYEKSESKNENFAKGVLVDKTQLAINETLHLKNDWNKLGFEKREKLIDIITRPENYIEFPKTKLSIEKQEEIIKQFIIKEFSFSNNGASELLELSIEDGFGNLSRKAIDNIINYMRKGLEYSEACNEAGYHHSLKKYKNIDRLPYYGEILEQHCLGRKEKPNNNEEKYGKINNATVHVALNQLRLIVNELLSLYGKPFDISVEYARDIKASQKERLKMSDTRDKNELENQKIVEEVKSKIGLTISSRVDIQKYKIWKNLGNQKGGNVLDKECPFSGEKIGLTELFNGNKFQVEHILPFSRTMDDSLDNKVIATISSNKYKGNRTPWEAFSESKDGFNWKEIQKRAKKLPLEKQWRFQKNAMDKFSKNEGPIARALNDTRYMTTLIQEYLMPICSEKGFKTIQSIPGQLTSMVRKSWGLNEYKSKDNEDDYRSFHNHHAIDAIIVSCISRGQVTKVSKDLMEARDSIITHFKEDFYKLRDFNTSEKERKEIKEKIRNFRTDKEAGIIREYIPVPDGLDISKVREDVANINISYKPKLKDIKDRKSTIGQLHEDTAYGLVKFIDENSLNAEFKTIDLKTKKKKLVTNDIVTYIPIFRNKEDKDEYYNAYKDWFINDSKARAMIAKTKDEKALKQAQAEKELKTIEKLRNVSIKAFKWFVGGGNFCAEIYEVNSNNKIGGLPTNNQAKWESEIISNYNATIRERRDEKISYWHSKYPNAKRIMTLKINDMVKATFTREEAFDEKFSKGIQNYVRERFEFDENLEKTDILFRVKKISSDGTVFLRPHSIAKEKSDTKCWIASSGSLKNYRARKVFVTPAGRIKNAA